MFQSLVAPLMRVSTRLALVMLLVATLFMVMNAQALAQQQEGTSEIGLRSGEKDAAGQPLPNQEIVIHPSCTGTAYVPSTFDNEVIAGGATECGSYKVEEAFVSSDLQVKKFGVWDSVDIESNQAAGTNGITVTTSTAEVECSGQEDYRNDTEHWVLDGGLRYSGPGM